MKTLRNIILSWYVHLLIQHKRIIEPPKPIEYPLRYKVQTLLLKAIENAKHLDQLEFCRNYLHRFELKLGQEAPYPRFMLQVKIQELTKDMVVENENIKYSTATRIQNNFNINNNRVIVGPAWSGPY